uniref:Uncharacterized protein n=1 Tax=Romanomermis culicivorax TaxID=13658 RepID=A0A915JS76_ROMCU
MEDSVDAVTSHNSVQIFATLRAHNIMKNDGQNDWHRDDQRQKLNNICKIQGNFSHFIGPHVRNSPSQQNWRIYKIKNGWGRHTMAWDTIGQRQLIRGIDDRLLVDKNT